MGLVNFGCWMDPFVYRPTRNVVCKPERRSANEALGKLKPLRHLCSHQCTVGIGLHAVHGSGH